MKYKSKIEGNENVILTFNEEKEIRIKSSITDVHGYIKSETKKAWNCRINIGHKYIDLNLNRNEWEEQNNQIPTR